MSWKTVAGVAVGTCQRHVPTFFSIYLGMILPGASKCFFWCYEEDFHSDGGCFCLPCGFCAGPRHLKVKEHDFGYIKEAKGAVSHTFELKNTGDKPLVILQVVTSCGCTRPEFPTKPIKPGKTAKIKVTFNPAGRSGAFMKPVKVKTSGDEGRTTLTIRGTIIPRK